MSPIQWIIEDLQQVRDYANNIIEHLDDGMWYRQPQDDINPIAWQVGHMAVAQYGLCLKRLRGERPDDGDLIPASFLAAFGKGSIPATSPDEYPTTAELLDVFHRVHLQVITEVSGLSVETLGETVTGHPMFATRGGALRFSAKHEMLHVGQVAQLRRLFGGPSLR